MIPFFWTLIWNIIISFWIILTILVVKFFKNKLINYINYITAITVWLLLWIIFLWFIPELKESNLEWDIIWLFILFWIFVFYVLELFMHWHHCHDLSHIDHSCHNSHSHNNESWILIFWSTLLHNIFHWIVLFWAFWINLAFWITTTFAILLHSIPQNIVNYIMNHKFEKYSFIAAFWWVFWALLTFPISSFLINNKYVILSIILWWLLYTALTDIFPEFKNKWSLKSKIVYLLFIIIWIILYLWFEELILH